MYAKMYEKNKEPMLDLLILCECKGAAKTSVLLDAFNYYVE